MAYFPSSLCKLRAGVDCLIGRVMKVFLPAMALADKLGHTDATRCNKTAIQQLPHRKCTYIQDAIRNDIANNKI